MKLKGISLPTILPSQNSNLMMRILKDVYLISLLKMASCTWSTSRGSFRGSTWLQCACEKLPSAQPIFLYVGPPAVHPGLNLCHISRKHSEYCKRVKKQREKADALMMQTNFKVPTVKALMACPISCFIHFATNECGYS